MARRLLTSWSMGHEGGSTNSDALVQMLRDAIVDVVLPPQSAITPQERRVLLRRLDQALTPIVAGYSAARDLQLEQAHAEHFAFLAHELRTPLSNIQMSMDLLQRGIDPATVIPRVRRSVTRLRELMDNEITNARLSAGSTINSEVLVLGPLVIDIAEEFRAQAADRGIVIEHSVAHPLVVDGDARLLRSVFTNLVVNAVKFTKRGGTISIRCYEDGNYIVCEIADGCGGLEEGAEERMFARYEQEGVDRSGFGLGLAIVAEGVARHSGRVSVRNDPGHGCTMIVRLPARAG